MIRMIMMAMIHQKENLKDGTKDHFSLKFRGPEKEDNKR